MLKGSLRKELLETIRAVHAGQKRLSSEVAAEIAEHATDVALTHEKSMYCGWLQGAMRTKKSPHSYLSPKKR